MEYFQRGLEGKRLMIGYFQAAICDGFRMIWHLELTGGILWDHVLVPMRDCSLEFKRK